MLHSELITNKLWDLKDSYNLRRYDNGIIQFITLISWLLFATKMFDIVYISWEILKIK